MIRPFALLAILAVASSATAQAPVRPSIDPTAPQTVTLQPAQPSADGESTVVEELEVLARQRGPAMWSVVRGDSEVVIVGAYSPLPHLLDWDKARLERALDGATAFYEPSMSVGALDQASLFFADGAFRNGGGKTLNQTIGPVRVERLNRMVSTSHADPQKMQPYKPAIAGILAYQTFLRSVGFSAEKPGTTIRKLVDAHHVPRRNLAKLSTSSAIRSLQRMDAPGQLACFDATLDQTEWDSAHGLLAGKAWAAGRVSDLRRLMSTAIRDRCLMAAGGARAVLAKAVSDSVASLEEILSRPGRSVVLLDVGLLLERDGVLDRLKAKGAQITVPPG